MKMVHCAVEEDWSDNYYVPQGCKPATSYQLKRSKGFQVTEVFQRFIQGVKALRLS